VIWRTVHEAEFHPDYTQVLHPNLREYRFSAREVFDSGKLSFGEINKTCCPIGQVIPITAGEVSELLF
jgi:hypothetical protein